MDMNRNPEQYTSDKLLRSFKQSSFTLALLVSLGIHVLFIGGTSVGYIMDHWVNPEAAKQRKAEALALKQAADKSNLLAKATTSTNVPAPAGGAAATAAVSNAPAAGASAAATNDLSRTNTAMMKQITETAKPEEIPPAPNDLGISIQDTNPQ